MRWLRMPLVAVLAVAVLLDLQGTLASTAERPAAWFVNGHYRSSTEQRTPSREAASRTTCTPPTSTPRKRFNQVPAS